MNSKKYPERVKHGLIKEVVLFASVNQMSAKVASRHFSVPANSIYHAARRMGVSLNRADKKPAV